MSIINKNGYFTTDGSGNIVPQTPSWSYDQNPNGVNPVSTGLSVVDLQSSNSLESVNGTKYGTVVNLPDGNRYIYLPINVTAAAGDTFNITFTDVTAGGSAPAYSVTSATPGEVAIVPAISTAGSNATWFKFVATSV